MRRTTFVVSRVKRRRSLTPWRQPRNAPSATRLDILATSLATMTRALLPSAHRSAHVLNALAAPYAPTRDTTRLAATLSRRRSATAEDHALNERCVWKLRRREATRVMASARASARALASDRHDRNAISEILNAPRANILATRRRRERVSLV